jgi:hypothetical protein
MVTHMRYALLYPTTDLPRICSTSNDSQAKGFKDTVAMWRLHAWPFTEHGVGKQQQGNLLGRATGVQYYCEGSSLKKMAQEGLWSWSTE